MAKKEALETKLEVLADFGITQIPENYFDNCRSQRDLGLRANELIAKMFIMLEKEEVNA